jgi:hypothetical protein
MWIIQTPKKVALWNKRYFEEKNGECAAYLKYSVLIFDEKIYKMQHLEVSGTPVLYKDARFLKVKAYRLRDAPTSLTFKNRTFCPHCINVFCIYLRTNSDLCHSITNSFYNRDEKCLQRGTDWVFKQSGLRFVFKGLSMNTSVFNRTAYKPNSLCFRTLVPMNLRIWPLMTCFIDFINLLVYFI